jgi:hypothetical protein
MKFKIRLVNEEEELQAWQTCNEHELTTTLTSLANAPWCLQPGDRYTIERVDAHE